MGSRCFHRSPPLCCGALGACSPASSRAEGRTCPAGRHGVCVLRVQGAVQGSMLRRTCWLAHAH